MSFIARRWIWIPAILLPPLFAQALPDAATLLRQKDEAWARPHSLRFVQEETTEIIGLYKQTSVSHEVRVNPGKRWSQEQGPDALLIVSNGEWTWMYDSSKNEFTKIAAALGDAGMVAARGTVLPTLEQPHTTAKMLREETLHIDGINHSCWVVEETVATQGPRASRFVSTYWIDKTSGFDLKSTLSVSAYVKNVDKLMRVRSKTVIRNLEVDVPVSDELFSFTPPAGAKEVEALNGHPAVDLTGNAAPPFELQGIDGHSYSLTEFRGKVVLLDFWATWCAPCRESIPYTEKVFRQYNPRGLVVLGVNVGEDRKTVEAFLRKSPMAYPVVLSADSGILQSYQVTAYPTFVLIDADGKIVAYKTGFSGDGMLQAMLQQAAGTLK